MCHHPPALNAEQNLEEMVANGYIKKIVDEPTEWVNSIIAVMHNNKVWICIGPCDLNKVIKWEHYPMCTIEEVVSFIPNTRIFSVLDTKSGFLQIELGEASSLLMMMNMPLGRFHWLRFPFGIKCAPEHFQLIMDKTVNGIDGTTSIMDDTLILHLI